MSLVRSSRSARPASISRTVSGRRTDFCWRPASTYSSHGISSCRPVYVRKIVECRTHPPHNLHIRRPRPITRCNSIHNPQYIPLHHAHEIQVVFALSHVAEVLDEVHYICAVVHRILTAHPLALHSYDMQNVNLDLHTRSSCSRMHECRSSSMSLYLRA